MGTPRREMQYGIAQLLTLTACVAVLLGAARWVFSERLAEEFGRDWKQILAVFLLFTSFNTLAPLPTVWAAFARSAAPWLVLAALYTIGITVAEVLAFDAVLGPGPDNSILFWINGTLFLVLTATLLSFRFSGYRLTASGN